MYFIYNPKDNSEFKILLARELGRCILSANIHNYLEYELSDNLPTLLNYQISNIKQSNKDYLIIDPLALDPNVECSVNTFCQYIIAV